MVVMLFWTFWCLAAFVGSATLTGQLVTWTLSRGLLDIPNDRSSHTRPTPRGGGLAIVAVMMLAALLTCGLYPQSAGIIAAVALPAAAIAAVSWLDDLKPVQNRTRFGVHLGAAIAATALLGPLPAVQLGSLGSLDFGAAAWPLTILWIVGLTNAFNFMDGIDGIAGITAAAAGCGLAAAAAAVGAPPTGALAAALAGAALGFLAHNWQPAKIFMGDVGSAFCGFMLAVIPLAAPAGLREKLVPVVVAALWPFLLDTTFTLLRRAIRRENIFQAHRTHLYQRLTVAGWSHRSVARLYGMLSAITAALAAGPFIDPECRLAADNALLAMLLAGAAGLAACVFLAEKTQSLRTEEPAS